MSDAYWAICFYLFILQSQYQSSYCINTFNMILTNNSFISCIQNRLKLLVVCSMWFTVVYCWVWSPSSSPQGSGQILYRLDACSIKKCVCVHGRYEEFISTSLTPLLWSADTFYFFHFFTLFAQIQQTKNSCFSCCSYCPQLTSCFVGVYVWRWCKCGYCTVEAKSKECKWFAWTTVYPHFS